MKRNHLFICGFLCAMALMALAACSKQQSGSADAIGIPLPTAYPRLSLYDTTYCDAALPLGFLVNSNTKISNPKQQNSTTDNQWVDIIYPAYGLTLHCTFIPVNDSTRESITAQRLERMALNIGLNYAKQTELAAPSGCSTLIFNTKGRSLTPLQFLSIGEQWIISGAAKFAADSVNPDSVRPLLEAVQSDIIYAAKRLH